MEMQSVFGILAGTLSLVAWAFYIVAILKGTTKPNRATWWVLTLVGLIILASYYEEGARETVWIPITYVIGPLIVGFLSLKYGDGKKWEDFDKWCLAGSVAGAALWALSGSALTALIINIFIDFLGILPTIKKSYLRPEGEDITAWTLASLASILNLTAVASWKFSVWVYPVYMAFFNILIMSVIFYGHQRR